MFFDGEEKPVTYVYRNNATARTITLNFGREYSGYWFNGIIDEVRIYNRVLTAQEISDLYNHYGYTTPNYAGRVLVRKRIDPEPITSVGNEETSEAPIIIAQRRLLIIGI